MVTAPYSLAQLRAHQCWSPIELQQRLDAMRPGLERRYKWARIGVNVLFFAAAALAALGLLYQAHDIHPALLPYIALIVLALGYFALQLGTGLLNADWTLRMWCDEHGAVSLDADDLERLDALLDCHPDMAGIVITWRQNGRAIHKRDLLAIETCAQAIGEAQAAITARIPAFTGAMATAAGAGRG